MKKTSIILSTALALLICLLNGCKANVDLNNIDPSVQASMGIALPVGEVSAQLGDFLGVGNVDKYIQVDDKGVLFFRDTFNIKRSFYKINLKKYISNAYQRFDVGSIEGVGGNTIPKGLSCELRFPLTIELSNINTVFDNERLDSIWVRDALFTSNFTLKNLPLKSQDIKRLDIELDNNFTFASGKSRIINIPLPQPNCIGIDIPINVEEFFLNLMKDRKKKPSNANTINKINIDFIFTIVPTSDIYIPTNAQIDYNFIVNILDYHAVWGWFNPSNQMRDNDTLCIADEWKEWNDIKKLVAPFAEPEVEMNVYHSIGAPLILDGKYLFVKSTEPDSQPIYATFDGSNELAWPMPNYVGLTDELDKVVKNTYVFSEDPGKGHLDNLFKTRPDSIGYNFSIYPNNAKAQNDGIDHYRLTENTNLDLEAIVTLPLTFNEGMDLAYSDTINDIDISAYQIDSLIAEVEMVEKVEVNEVKLILQITNTIPFDIVGEFVFLNDSNQAIDIQLTEVGNKILIEGPTEVENGVIQSPSKSTIVISIDQAAYDKLTQLKRIEYKASLGDNTTYVRMLDKSGLKIHLAVAANVTADFNLDSLFNNDNEEVTE